MKLYSLIFGAGRNDFALKDIAGKEGFSECPGRSPARDLRSAPVGLLEPEMPTPARVAVTDPRRTPTDRPNRLNCKKWWLTKLRSFIKEIAA